MRNNLWDDPRVSRICDATGATEATVVGALYWLWAAGDEHTEDGHLPGLSRGGLDRKVRLPGFAEAVLSVGWLLESDAGLTIPRFDEHNGASAKRRSLDAIRKATFRVVSASDADKKRTGADKMRRNAELEKRRVEKTEDLRSSSEIRSANSEEEESREAASEPEAEPEVPLVVFPTVAGRASSARSWGLTAQHLSELSVGFPDLDILAEARKALLWVQAKSDHRKTADGMRKFLLGWMTRANNDGPRRRGYSTPPANGHAPPGKPSFRQKLATLNFPDNPRPGGEQP